jgi:hypothetical protein
MAEQQPSGEVPGVNVNDSQGVQIGSGDQYNTWMLEPPLDPSFLRVLNPHTAAERIRRMPHARAVDVLAKASPQDVTDALKVLLAVDEEKAVAVLADVSPGKAAELIEPLVQQAPWLEPLPEAAVATASHATKLKWGRQGKIGLLEHLSSSDTEGYMRDCASGAVFWTSAYGVQSVTGSMDKLHKTESLDCLGFPISPQGRAEKSPYGTEGIFQEFEQATIFSSSLGTYSVLTEHVMSAYECEGRSGGRLGFPRAKLFFLEYLLVQLFEGGVICETYIDVDDACAVFNDVEECLNGIGGLSRWLPLTPERIGKASPPRDPYRVQHFGESSGEMLTVYSSAKHGAHCVRGKIKEYYDQNKAAASLLGLPVAEAAGNLQGSIQRFEFGTVFDRQERETLAVSSGIIDAFGGDGEIPIQLGWPTSEELPIGSDESGCIQFFEGGVVTLRDGKHEVWLRSGREAVEPDTTSTAEDPPGYVWYNLPLNHGWKLPS